jgi:hypothetical protein
MFLDWDVINIQRNMLMDHVLEKMHNRRHVEVGDLMLGSLYLNTADAQVKKEDYPADLEIIAARRRGVLAPVRRIQPGNSWTDELAEDTQRVVRSADIAVADARLVVILALEWLALSLNLGAGCD